MQQPQWKGSQPQRFSGGRIHLKLEDQFANSFQLRNTNNYPKGIKTFSPNPTSQAIFKPRIRVYEDRYNQVTKQIDLRGIKTVELPHQNQRVRAEKRHLSGGRQTYNQLENRGIKSFDQANKSKDNHYLVENSMQKKMKFYGLQSLRNDLTVISMGDKSYKYPQYAPEFYKDGGLIPGSTHKPRAAESFIEIKKGSILTRPNWDTKVKMDEAHEQTQVIDSIQQWQKTTLKQNNPNWNDPDTFFERMQAKQSLKDLKKGKK